MPMPGTSFHWVCQPGTLSPWSLTDVAPVILDGVVKILNLGRAGVAWACFCRACMKGFVIEGDGQPRLARNVTAPTTRSGRWRRKRVSRADSAPGTRPVRGPVLWQHRDHQAEQARKLGGRRREREGALEGLNSVPSLRHVLELALTTRSTSITS